VVEYNKKGPRLHQRRGISTIVGAAIFLVLFASATSTFFLAMDAQRDTINSQRAISDAIMEKTKEKFSIAVSTDESNSNKLGIQVKNLGTNPVEIDDIWIVNKSGSFPAKKYLIDYKDSVIPPGYGSNILENTPLTMLPDDYDIKVVSTLGTIEKSEFNVGGNNYLRATLLVIPPDVKINKNVTITMHVENIGPAKLLNVAPAFDVPNISTTLDPPVPPTPAPVDLDSGESVFFTWQYTVKGPGLVAGNKITFDNYANATIADMTPTTVVNSNNVQESIKLLEADFTDIIVLEQDLLAQPEIFMVIPSPMGTDSGSKGLWGANIVNPTPAPMTVSRVTITLLSPRSNNADLMFNPTNSPGAKCDPVAVGITNTADWKCAVQNQLSWTNLASPITIPPFSAAQFTAKVHADRLFSSGAEVPALIVVGDVFTNLGEFSKAGYSTSFDDGGTSIVNVYLSDTQWSTQSNDIFTTYPDITSNSQVTLYATLTDFELDDHVVESGSTFVVNVPKDWVIENPVTDIDGLGDFSIVYNTWSDGSSQIVGTLLADYDGSGHGANLEGLSIKVTVRAPTVTNERMYVMYLLAEGEVDSSDFTMGPLTEALLRVIP
jgi:archaellum component FlaF (FlaF/FlaG flagellin family)